MDLTSKKLNEGTHFVGHPIKNSPELMPLYCSLFQELNGCIQTHIFINWYLFEDAEQAFSLSSIKRVYYAYLLRISKPSEDSGMGIPTSYWICEDLKGYVENLKVKMMWIVSQWLASYLCHMHICFFRNPYVYWFTTVFLELFKALTEPSVI